MKLLPPARFLARKRLPFCGHTETCDSIYSSYVYWVQKVMVLTMAEEEGVLTNILMR